MLLKLVRGFEPYTPAAGYYERPVNLGMLSAGIYMLRVKIGDDERNIKLLKN